MIQRHHTDDAIVFPEVLSEAAAKDQMLVAEKADLSVEAPTCTQVWMSRTSVAALASREAANRLIVGQLVFIIFLLEVLR